MQLILTEIKRLTATEDMKCESSDMFWSIPKPMDYSLISFSDMLLFFKARYGRIKTGEKYLQLLFVDEDGEQFTMLCLEPMNKFMFNMGYYPEFINNALLEYRKQHRLKQK